jgi:alpha-L-rhamnosidase
MKNHILTLALLLMVAGSSHAAVVPADLRCEYTVDPIGVDAGQPRLFWTIRGNERGEQQTAYEILAASSPTNLAADEGDLWDSGKVVSDDSIQIPYAGKALISSQAVFWKVRVWGKAGDSSAWSQPATWTMGILSSTDWRAKWVSAPTTNFETLQLRREIGVKGDLKRAIANVCGLGQYVMTINGAQAGDDYLSPGWTDYRKTCLYDTRDLTSLLHPGTNAIGLLLGNGMYNVHGGRFTKFKGSFGQLQAIAQIRLEYADGSVEIIGTDDHWRVAPGPITFSSIYGGEDFDSRLVPRGWDLPGFDDSQWTAAQIMGGPGGELRGLSVAAPPIREFQIHRPVASHTLTNGDVLYDLGQNAAHVLQISIAGPAGSRVRLSPSELTNHDGFASQSSMGAGHRGPIFCEFTKSAGGTETWSPDFFYVGCRYIQIHCMAAGPGGELPELEGVEGIVVHSESDSVGEFECSDDLFNRIFTLVRWAQMNNMVSLMTDCPHRERLGWLEEDHLNGPALRYDFDLARLFTKQLHDMSDAQTADGLVPNVAPEYITFKGGFRDSPEWGSAAIIVPWQQYEFDGDLALLKEHYNMMKRYVAYLGGTANSNNIVSHGLGDWYDLGPKPPGIAQLTPVALTATAFYYHDAWIVSRVAALLGEAGDARQFGDLADNIRASFNQTFFNPTNRSYATGSQTANAMPLAMGICEPANRAPVLNAIVADVRAHGNALTAGDVGYRYLLLSLAEGGRSDVIFDMNHQSDKPGYGYQLKKGATSLTEAWSARTGNSQDHFMLGQIQEWFYHDLAGIQNAPDSAGFKKIIINPQPVGDLTWVKASFRSIRGEIVSDWKHEDGTFTLNISIPANSTATVFVPASSPDDVTEGGGPADTSRGVTFLRMEKDRALYNVESGDYIFKSAM